MRLSNLMFFEMIARVRKIAWLKGYRSATKFIFSGLRDAMIYLRFFFVYAFTLELEQIEFFTRLLSRK